jgi:hypothetical protein
MQSLGVQCPRCGIDLAVPPGADRFRCGQCGSILAIAGQSGQSPAQAPPMQEDEDLRRALALSAATASAEAKPSFRPAQEDDDPELRRALAMSASAAAGGGGGSNVPADPHGGTTEEEEMQLAMALSAAEAKDSGDRGGGGGGGGGRSGEWEWENESKEGAWVEFDREACATLEEAAALGRDRAIVHVQGLRFDVDIQRMTQHDSITGMKCRVRRQGGRGRTEDEHKPAFSPAAALPAPAPALPHEPPAPLSRQLSTHSYEELQATAQREAAAAMARIDEWHRNTREQFVDAEFPPCDESLYLPRRRTGEAGEPWVCGACNGNNAPRNECCANCRTPRRPVARWLRADELTQMARARRGGSGGSGGMGSIGELWSALLGVPQRAAQRGAARMSPFADEGRAAPRPDDILQGALGDCWLLSAMAVLAERPELVRRVVLAGGPNAAGAYQLRLCKDGVWATVTVDDVFPCLADGRLAYSKAAGGALWVPLIEKALAKLHGSYEALASGTMAEGLGLLTGAPCESLEVESDRQRAEREAQAGAGGGGLKQPPPDLNELWARVLSYRAARFLLGASCGGSSVDAEAAEAMGLHTRHAYSVLDVQAGYMDAGPPYRLLKLRNPWGSGEWRGDWSDSSPLWAREPGLAARLRPDGRRDDGVFWMAFDDFATYFTTLDVCKVRLDWAEVRVDGEFPSSAGANGPFVHAFELRPLEEGAVATDTALNLAQRSTRGAPSAAAARQVDMGLCVLRERGGGEWEFVADAPRKVASNVCAEALLEGDGAKYVVLPLGFNQMHAAARAPFTLAVHSAKPVLVSRVQLSCSAFARALVLRAQRRGSVRTPFEGMQMYTLTQDGGIMIVAVNSHPQLAFGIELDCGDSVNLVSSRGSLRTVDAIRPLHAQLLLVMSVLEESGGYSWSLQANFRSMDARLAPSNSPAVEARGIHDQIALPGAGAADGFFAPSMAMMPGAGGMGMGGAPGMPDCRMQ